MIEQNNILTKTEFLLYRNEDGKIRIETRMENETVWLTQAQMCELFDKSKRTISEHIRNIFSEGELQEEQVVRKFRTTAADGKNYLVAYYNLDVIISVGYRGIRVRPGFRPGFYPSSFLAFQYFLNPTFSPFNAPSPFFLGSSARG